MANVTLKRYSGSAWVSLDPTTSMSQVSGLTAALAAKLALAGGTMSGAIAMGGYGITGASGIANASGGIAVTGSGTATITGGTSVSIVASGGEISLSPSGTNTINANSKRISAVGTPTADSDAATKLYVDNKALAGLNPTNPVYVATLANVATLSGTQTVDGVSISVNDTRVLLAGQTTPSQNGIYTKQDSTWTKITADCEVGSMTFVESGTYNDWIFVKSDDVTTAYDWIQFSKPDTITASGNLQKSGTNITTVTNQSLNSSTATTQTQGDNSTKVATTAYVDTGLGTKAATSHANAATTYGAGTTALYGHVMLVDALTDSAYAAGKALSSYQGYVLNTAIGGKAPTSHASSATTYGVGSGTNYGHAKTINNLTTASYVDGEALAAAQGKVLNDSKAPLASPALTGTPTAPTATAGTNTTQIATTAFTTGAIATHIALENPHGTDLLDLGDVVASGMTAGDGLYYNGTNWNNRPVNRTMYGTSAEPIAGEYYAGDLYFYEA